MIDKSKAHFVTTRPQPTSTATPPLGPPRAEERPAVPHASIFKGSTDLRVNVRENAHGIIFVEANRDTLKVKSSLIPLRGNLQSYNIKIHARMLHPHGNARSTPPTHICSQGK